MIQELRIIVASATLDAEQFRDFFETNRCVCRVFPPMFRCTFAFFSCSAAIGHHALVGGLPYSVKTLFFSFKTLRQHVNPDSCDLISQQRPVSCLLWLLANVR